MLALALGSEPAAGAVDWTAVLAAAEREGCAALCWLRGGERIRERAPRAVRDAFRAAALAVAARAERQVATLADVVATLDGIGADPVALKGAPLALFAHGDPLVRQSTDVDMLVAREHRARVDVALRARGWRLVQGTAPWEETWVRGGAGHLEHLEVQSALFGEMLVHLEPAGVPIERMPIGGVEVSVLAAHALPAYLSVHLSRHRLAPLLWFVDLASVWSRLTADQRTAARAFARRHGLAAYLRWGSERAAAIESYARGDQAAARLLGRLDDRGRGIGHPALRDVRFAPTPIAAVHALAAWAVPPTTRGTWQSMATRAARRAGRIARALAGAAPAIERTGAATVSPPATRALDVTREELGELVATAMASGNAFWLRVRGESMRPSIPSGALVRLLPPPAAPLRKGTVVLARLPDGSFALHRVLVERDARVWMRGDGVLWNDPAVPRTAVLAVADQLQTGGVPVAIAPREPLSAFRLLRPLRRARLRMLARTRTAPRPGREARA